MSKETRLKTQLDMLKVALLFIATSVFGLIAWMVKDHQSITGFQIFMATGGAVILSAVFYWVLKIVRANLDELEKI